MKTYIQGELEIDHDRGVIYFHCSDSEFVKKANVVTALRICRLPTPIPAIQDRMLDISHMYGCDWKEE